MKQLYTKEIPRYLLILIGFLVVTNLATFYTFRRGAEATSDCGGEKVFINPRFKCRRNAVIDKKGYAELKSEITAYIEEKKTTDKAKQVGVWFRDLDAGPTFGINDRRDFIPASLLKLPLVLTFLQLAEG